MTGARNRRIPDVRLVKRDCTYTVEEVSELLGVHANTVRNWMANGLKQLDQRRPILIHGSDLGAFLRSSTRRRKAKCAHNELYCFRCRQPRRPVSSQVQIERQTSRILRLAGTCEHCGSRMFKAISPRDQSIYEEIFSLPQARPEHMSVCAEPAVNCDLEKENEP